MNPKCHRCNKPVDQFYLEHGSHNDGYFCVYWVAKCHGKILRGEATKDLLDIAQNPGKLRPLSDITVFWDEGEIATGIQAFFEYRDTKILGEHRTMELIKGLPAKVKTYTITLGCSNCGKEAKYEIPWGVMLAEYDTTCPHCGCSRQKVQEYNDQRNDRIKAWGPPG